jgi:four helix bundle protein
MAFAFEDLAVYQKSLDLSILVIDAIDDLETPRKHFRVIEQLEASCTSITLNIAEGKGRYSRKEFKQFLYIARGSLYETVTMLKIFKRKNWLKNEVYDILYEKADEVNRMLSGLINSLSA